MRTDSKGSPLRRAIVGERYWYDGFVEKIENRSKLFQQSTKSFQQNKETKETAKSVIETKPTISPLLSPPVSPLLSPVSSLTAKKFTKIMKKDSHVSFNLPNTSRFNLGFGVTD